MQARKIIVNADDFGMNSETTRAIVEAFDTGAISSTTLMANMPAFEEACELAKLHRLSGKIGVHLNLTEGRPLSAPIGSLPRFCDGAGNFRPRRTLFRLSGREKRAVETEFCAQIEACLARGIQPSHLDSHQHVHTEWPIGAIAIRVARRYGIGAIRLSRNCGPGIGFKHRLYKAAYNARLRLHGLAKTRYFGSARDVLPLLTTTQDDVEIMVHFVPASPKAAISADTGIQWPAPFRITSYAA